MNIQQVKSVLNKHKKRDAWFLDEYSVNPYSGCACNCLYCYIRGSKYGENMEEKLTIKSNAFEILDKQLNNRYKKKQFGIIAVGSATDAYMHHEEHYRITESFLQVILKYKFPVFISTKRTLIKRDIDLLKQIDMDAILPEDLQGRLNRGVILSVSVSTLDGKIAHMLEPGAATPSQRLQLVQDLKKEGFLIGVNAIPLLPFISDTEEELEKLAAAVKESGADYLLVGGLMLFGNERADSKTLYYRFLNSFYPDLIKNYDALYNNNYFSSWQHQSSLKQRAERLCAKYEIRNSILE